MKSDTFGPWLRERRREAGLSLRSAATQCGITFSYLSKVETGDLPPPASDTLGALGLLLCIGFVEMHLQAGRVPPLILQAFSEGVSRSEYDAIARILTQKGADK